jgi:hypothetical protein
MRVMSLLRKPMMRIRGRRDTVSVATAAPADELLSQHEQLCRELAGAESPAAANARLADLECRLGLEMLQSFPTTVSLCSTNVCNARCTFCDYTPKPAGMADFMSLDDVRRMSWLKYVSALNLNAGYGDSLANPHFGDIYGHVRQAHPHLHCSLVTNGLGLSESLSRQFVGQSIRHTPCAVGGGTRSVPDTGALDDLLISVNAARQPTWDALMRQGSFPRVLENIARLVELRKNADASKPRLALSMVLCKDNLAEAVEFVELAHRLGVEQVVFAHYLSVSLVGGRTMPAEQSLYFDRAHCDAMMAAAARRADELGVVLARPLPFDAAPTCTFVGDRVARAVPMCEKPWKSCVLSCLPGAERDREMVFCCFGAFYRIEYAKEDLSEATFLARVWNHPAARYVRRTINGRGFNPVCEACRSVDRFDPANASRYRELYRAISAAFTPDGGQIEARLRAAITSSPLPPGEGGVRAAASNPAPTEPPMHHA